MGVLNGRFPTSDLEHIRYQQCPACHKYAILLVDVQTETVPRTDQQGNKQYHCLSAGGPSRSIRMARLFNHNWSLSSNSQDESEKKVLRPILFVTIAI